MLYIPVWTNNLFFISKIISILKWFLFLGFNDVSDQNPVIAAENEENENVNVKKNYEAEASLPILHVSKKR